MKVVNRFSWHKQHGDFAERYFRRNYFKGLGLGFRKIRKDKQGQKPEGFIINQNKERIAVAEIKLIKYQKRVSGVAQLIKIDETITRAIRKGKKQLQTVSEPLPKIVYLILDDSFAKLKAVLTAVFGKWITIQSRSGQTIYNGYSGLCTKYKQDDKLRDNLLSAVICYKQTLDSYEIYIIRNCDTAPLPKILLDKPHLKEWWDYNSERLKKKL